MKPIQTVEYEIPQHIKDRAKGLSITEQVNLFQLIKTEMIKDHSTYFSPDGDSKNLDIQTDPIVESLLVCDDILVGIAISKPYQDTKMFFDKKQSVTHYLGGFRTGADYYDFVSYATNYDLKYKG